MAYCEPTDFMFPILADIYYPLVEQGAYGNLTKTWVLDRTIACNFSGGGAALKEEITPNVNITQDSLLIGRVKTDIRKSYYEENNSITNVVVSNIRDSSQNPIYMETSGPRSGKSTIFEIATQEPFVGPFGSVEYYKVVLRRSENQAVDV